MPLISHMSLRRGTLLTGDRATGKTGAPTTTYVLDAGQGRRELTLALGRVTARPEARR